MKKEPYGCRDLSFPPLAAPDHAGAPTPGGIDDVPPNTPEDVNADGAITIEDVALVLLNYIDFTVPGEKP